MERLELTGIVKKEGRQYSALCLELDVASCGDTQEEAMQALKDAVETYIQYMVEEGRKDEIYRPVPLEALREFLTDVETKPVSRPFRAFALEYRRVA